MSDKTIELNEDKFDDVFDNSEEPVLMDFWAPWCGPCQMLSPIIEELAEEVDSKFKIYKINVDENPTAASKNGVMSIPTVLIVKKGEVKETFVGVQPKETFKEALEKHA